MHGCTCVCARYTLVGFGGATRLVAGFIEAPPEQWEAARANKLLYSCALILIPFHVLRAMHVIGWLQ